MLVEKIIFQSEKIPHFRKGRTREVVRRLETMPENFFEFVKKSGNEIEVYLGKSPFVLKYQRNLPEKLEEISPNIYQKTSREYLFMHNQDYFNLRVGKNK